MKTYLNNVLNSFEHTFYRQIVTIKDQRDTSVLDVSKKLEIHMKNLLLQFFITTSKDKNSTNFLKTTSSGSLWS